MNKSDVNAEMRTGASALPAERMTTLKRGLYSCVMTGPQGVVLDFGMEIEARSPERVALDDEFLKELLVINSVIGGWIEAMLHEKQAEKMRTGASALPSQAGEVLP